MKPVLLPVTLSALLLAGCGSTTQATTPAPSATPSPSVTATATPTPSPTPTAMSLQQAGKLYLSGICPSNAAGDRASKIIDADPFNLAASKTAAAGMRDALRKAIERFTAKGVIWPTVVKTDVNTLLDGLYFDLSQAGNLASQVNPDAFISSWNAWTDPSRPDPYHAAGQKVRVKLGLSSDAMASCGLK